MIVKYKLGPGGVNPVIPPTATLDNGHFKSGDWYLGYLDGEDLATVIAGCAVNEMVELSDEDALIYAAVVLPKNTQTRDPITGETFYVSELYVDSSGRITYDLGVDPWP